MKAWESENQEALSEINVTPLVDVMLVLLTIFMVTAPLMKATIDLELPEAQGKPVEVEEKTSVTIRVLKDGSVVLNGKKLTMKELQGALKNLRKRDIFIEGDKHAPYGLVIKVLDLARQAGITSVNLVTQLPEK